MSVGLLFVVIKVPPPSSNCPRGQYVPPWESLRCRKRSCLSSGPARPAVLLGLGCWARSQQKFSSLRGWHGACSKRNGMQEPGPEATSSSHSWHTGSWFLGQQDLIAVPTQTVELKSLGHVWVLWLAQAQARWLGHVQRTQQSCWLWRWK